MKTFRGMTHNYSSVKGETSSLSTLAYRWVKTHGRRQFRDWSWMHYKRGFDLDETTLLVLEEGLCC